MVRSRAKMTQTGLRERRPRRAQGEGLNVSNLEAVVGQDTRKQVKHEDNACENVGMISMACWRAKLTQKSLRKEAQTGPGKGPKCQLHSGKNAAVD